MKEFAGLVRDMLKKRGVGYGDVRVVRKRTQEVAVKNGEVEHVETELDEGFGVKVYLDGYFGFSSSSRSTADEAVRVVDEAITTAKASRLADGEPVELAEEPPAVASYITPTETDPFTVPLDEKIELLLGADAEMRRVSAIRLATGETHCWKEEKVFASTEGSLIEQTTVATGGGCTAYAFNDAEMQIRGYPSMHGGNTLAAGWESVRQMELVRNAEPTAREAAELLKAPPAPAGVMDLVIGGHQMVLQVHESVGHPLELDRVLGYEASYAGTSFATLDKLGSFKYGSEHVNIVADSTTPGALGTFGYDDEGVAAQRRPLLTEGVLVDYLSSRDTASVIGKRSSGAARSCSWNRIPLVRMVNVSLLPGKGSLEELLSGVKQGLFVDFNRSWSIDQKRLNFQFGTESGRLIRNGKLGELVKNPVYHGITPEFWRSCDGVAGEEEWRLWGLTNCGKGEPGQSMHVGHGTAPARFRKVQVGSTAK